MTDNTLVPTTSALDRLKRTAQRSSLDDLISARTKRSLLLVDCSGSMDMRVKSGERRIDQLRKVVDKLRSTNRVPLAAFGISTHTEVGLVDVVPEPSGGTPMHLAIEFGRSLEANHLIVVTDGCPDSPQLTLDAAKRFGGQIDVFFIGDEGDHGAKFCAELARVAGGKYGVTDLAGDGGTKQLAAKIVALLGDGSEVL